MGSVDLAAHELTFSMAVLGLLDGVNPCSLWVLSLLLALVVSSGSRIRTALVGLAFLTVAVSTYGLFMAGLFGVLSTVGVSLWVRLAVAAVAVGFAALNIKDYFWFQVGPSLALSDRYKPGLFRRMRGLLAPGMSGPALMGGAAVMALGVTLVELPCTAGLPVLWARRERPDARRHVSHAYLAKRRGGRGTSAGASREPPKRSPTHDALEPPPSPRSGRKRLNALPAVPHGAVVAPAERIFALAQRRATGRASG